MWEQLEIHPNEKNTAEMAENRTILAYEVANLGKNVGTRK